MAKQPKPIPMKKTIPQPAGNPAGRKGVPDMTIGGKKVRC